MINYYLPGFLESQRIYRALFWLRDEWPECFYDNVNIKKIYGCFPGMIWNGGSSWFGGGVSRKLIEDTFDFYSTTGVDLQLTFTNPLIEEKHCYDTIGNAVCEIACNYDNIEVLVTSPVLEDYLRKTYPKLKIDKSIVGTTRDRGTNKDTLESYLADTEKYNMVVFPRKYSKDLDFLNSVPEDKRNCFEILCTDPCSIHCPRLYSHYEDLARQQLLMPCEEGQHECSGFEQGYPFRNFLYRRFQISYDEIVKDYEPLGYTEFKLSGRISYCGAALRVVPYLIKPEYQLDVYQCLLDPFAGLDVNPDFS